MTYTVDALIAGTIKQPERVEVVFPDLPHAAQGADLVASAFDVLTYTWDLDYDPVGGPGTFTADKMGQTITHTWPDDWTGLWFPAVSRRPARTG